MRLISVENIFGFKSGVALFVLAIVLSASWFFGFLGDLAKPIAQTSPSANSCEVIYREPCHTEPIAVNEKFSFLYGQDNKYGLCEIGATSPEGRINDQATLEGGKCKVEKNLDSLCREKVLDSFNLSSLESVTIEGSDDRQRLMELGNCGRAYERLYSQ